MKKALSLILCLVMVLSLAACAAPAAEETTAPAETGDPVYRLYNPYAGDHHYTMDRAEADNLVSVGWNDEGIGWHSDGKEVPVYRLYNPNAVTGTHHYTTSVEERDFLDEIGWNYEGIGWYGIAQK